MGPMLFPNPDVCPLAPCLSLSPPSSWGALSVLPAPSEPCNIQSVKVTYHYLMCSVIFSPITSCWSLEKQTVLFFTVPIAVPRWSGGM